MTKERALLTEFLKSRGMKMTAQREKILDFFLKEGKHVSSDELFHRLQRRHPGIGRATVFRTLKLFTEANLASTVEFGDGAHRFENKHRTAHHDHLICTRCGRSFEFCNDHIEQLQEKVTRQYGFVPQRHRLDIFGICRKCRTSSTINGSRKP